MFFACVNRFNKGFRPQNTQLHQFLLILRCERSRVTVPEQINSKIVFALKGLGMYFIIYYNDTFSKIYFSLEVLVMFLTYLKTFFQPHH